MELDCSKKFLFLILLDFRCIEMCAATQDHLAYDFTSEENKPKWKGMFVSALEKVNLIQLIKLSVRFNLLNSMVLL